MDWFTISILGGCIVAIIMLLLILYFMDSAQQRSWNKFAEENNCKIVGEISGDTFNTFSYGSGGQFNVGVGQTPDKTIWKCDDGKTYIR